MAGKDDNPLKVFVSHLSRTPVERYEPQAGAPGGIVEEDELGWFFHNHGCAIADVRLMVDPSTNRCRGFGFVDFEDEASFRKALELHGFERPEKIKLDQQAGGRMHIEPAKRAEPSAAEKQLELARARDATEAMARQLKHREARVREMERELKVSRERQQQLDQLHQQHALEQQIARERQRQEEIRRADAEMERVEAALTAKLREEEERTRALEAMVSGVDHEQTRRHAQRAAQGQGAQANSQPHAQADAQAAVSEAETAALPKAEVMLPVAMEDEDGDEDAAIELRIKNTFLEYSVPPDIEPLVRTKTAPPSYTPAPWAIKRESSAILRSILDEKIEAESPDSRVREGLTRGKSADDKLSEVGDLAPAAYKHAPWDEDSLSVEEGPCVVRIRNLPLSYPEQLEEDLRAELGRLWSVARGLKAPELDEVRVAAPPQPLSYAAKAAGTEAQVRFRRHEDAAWLVDGRRGAWSGGEQISLHGRVLQAEWPAPAVKDWRLLRCRAETDASSDISYGTVGTRQSFSSAVARRAGAGGAPPGSLQAGPPGPQGSAQSGQGHTDRKEMPAATVAAPPARANRTVIISGISTRIPTHQVQAEVLDMLRRQWQRGGYIERFDPRVHLHRGEEGGLSVRPARNAGEENGGTCIVRLRNYADARWLVEQARGLNIEGKPVRASWARPRD